MKKLITFALAIMLALSVMLFASAEETEISYGKTYTLVTPASEGYPDDGIKLTDGVFGTIPDGANGYFSSGAYVGFNQNDVDDDGNFVIMLDLGRVYDDLSGFGIGFLNETSVGIFAPKSVTFAVSDTTDGTFTDVGTLDTAQSTADGVSETHFELLEETASGRFVRISIEHLGEYTNDNGETKSVGWTFIDEISVFSGSTTDESGEVSDLESDMESEEQSSVQSSEASSESSESSAPVVPGDDKTNTVVFILLSISAITMGGALFIGKKQKDY